MKKEIYCPVLLFVGISLSFLMTFCVDKINAQKHVIGNTSAGFFSCFCCVLNHLEWCEKNNKIPVVYWGLPGCQFYQSQGYDGSFNPWEYYFEPLSDLFYSEQDRVDNTYWFENQMCFSGWALDDQTRKKAHELITKYIRVKPSIQKKIDDFYQKNMAGKKTIGIHLRGTDKYLEEPVVPLSRYIDKANEISHGSMQFFIASDDSKLFEQAKNLLKGKVIYFDSFRASTNQHMWQNWHPQKARLGEEVLIEAILLSRCDLIIHGFSNVAAAALYFNPTVQNILFYVR
jgi:hypothetical protein